MPTPVIAIPPTQWIIAIGSLASALALGLKDWFFRPRIRLVLRHESDPEEINDRIVTKRLESGEPAAFVRLRADNRGRSTARNVAVSFLVHRPFREISQPPRRGAAPPDEPDR
jgi:hypothetical protein